MKIVNCKLKIVRKGFSLLEVITVIAIIMIMISVVLASGLTQNRKARELEAAAREVAAAIREAQNNALTGKNVTAGCSYAFSYNYGAITCSNSNTKYCISGCSATNYTLKNGVTFTTSGSFSFSIPFATLSAAPLPIVVCKGIVSNSNCYKVCVNSAGKVEEVKGNTLPACPS